jgi:hypothetical protein
MATKSRSALERERDLRRTAALYLRGLTQEEIAQRLQVSRQQISYDLKVLQRRWQASTLADFNGKKAAELAKVDELERTYWEAWERSCSAREVTTQERTQGGDGHTDEARLKAGVRKEQRDGNAEFLRGVERCIELRCKILGAFAAVKIAPTTPDGEEEWHASESEANAVLRVAFARLGLPLSGAGDAGALDERGQALDLPGADPPADGNNAGPVADGGATESENADPPPLFPASR